MTEQKRLIIFSFIFTIIIVLDGVTVVFSPYKFVRGLNTFVIIVLSMAVGAFIREIFVLKGNEKRNKEV